MKLLIITHLFPNSVNTRHGIFWLNKFSALVEQGVEVVVIAPVPYVPAMMAGFKKTWRNFSRVERTGTIEGIDVHYPRYFRPPGKWFRALEAPSMYWGIQRTVRKISLRFQFQAVIGGGLHEDGHAAYRVGRDYDIPALAYAIGNDINIYPFENRLIYRRTLRLLGQLDCVISVGEEFRNTIYEVFPSAKKTVEWNPIGVDLDAFRNQQPRFLRRKFGLAESDVIGLFVGYVVESKGIKDLLNAVNVLQDQKIKIFLVGAGDLESYAREYIRDHGLVDRVFLLGHMEHDSLPRVYASADFFVFPSHGEGSANAMVEAAAAGLPILASDIPQNRDILKDGENGLSFRVGVARDLADKMLRLANDSLLRERFSKRSLEVAARDHDRATCALGLIGIVKQQLPDDNS